jgi:predicted PurR-regulated permease PerM
MPVSYNSKPFPVTPNDRGRPSTDQHLDEALALARANRSPLSAFVSIALALGGLGLLWFGRSLLVATLCAAVVAVVASAIAWRSARRHRRPVGVAVAALAVALVTLAIVAVLWS